MSMTRRFSDEVRAAVDASGLSRYAICKAIGLDQSAMSRFMRGKGGMSIACLDRLAGLLGLRVVVERARDEGATRERLDGRVVDGLGRVSDEQYGA